MIANIFGPDLGYVVIIVLVVLVGGSQLPKIARNVGTAGKEFRKAQQEAEDEAAEAAAKKEARQQAPAPSAIGPAQATPSAPAATAAGDDDKLVISRSDLRKELSDMLEERQNGQ